MERYDHMAFQVSSMHAAIRFYTETLGFALASRAVSEEEGEEYAFLTLGDVRLELLQDLRETAYHRPQIKPPYCPHLAIETDDMAQAMARLRDMDVPIIRGPLEIPSKETWVYFADPDHNVLEYIQWFEKRPQARPEGAG
jgi:lactoylglutathione lyase